jgi:hypothetical protein
MKKIYQENQQLLASIFILMLTFTIIMITSMLLDVMFIQEQLIRQIMIHLLIAIQLFIGIRAVILINK